jgi:hypothetical protein
LPDENKLEEARKGLEAIAVGLQNKDFTVFVKAPASYFCLNVGGKKYILDLPIEKLIVELYGEETGQYITYESIFGTRRQSANKGYSEECPRFPTQSQLAINQKKIYF